MAAATKTFQTLRRPLCQLLRQRQAQQVRRWGVRVFLQLRRRHEVFQCLLRNLRQRSTWCSVSSIGFTAEVCATELGKVHVPLKP